MPLGSNSTLAPGDRYRISATWLDRYQMWLDDRITTDDFVETLERRGSVGEIATVGRTIHELIETHGVHLNQRHFDAHNIMLDGDVSFPIEAQDKREQKTVTPMANDRANLVCVVDAQNKREVKDWKFTGNTSNAGERFAESWQWRAYLAVTGCSRFRYAVYPLKRKRGLWTVGAGSQYVFHSYSGVSSYINAVVSDLCRALDQLCAGGFLDCIRVAQHPMIYCPRCHGHLSALSVPGDGPPWTQWAYDCDDCYSEPAPRSRLISPSDRLARLPAETPARAFIFD